jgi:hypothetical protein
VKRLLIFTLALIFALAACGGGKSAEVGGTVQFGQIDWIVLAVENDKALLLSEKVLETRATDIGTYDKVFLLSVGEVNNYMGDTAHRDMKNAKIAEHIKSGDTCWWWLRSPYYGSRASAHSVSIDGSVSYGSAIGGTSGVRPALWLNL